MPTIEYKRIYEVEPKKAHYVYIDRLYPRGIRSTDLRMSHWVKNIAPSNEMRKKFHDDIEKNWKDFKHQYLQELEMLYKTEPELKELITYLKTHKHVTLLYSSKNERYNNARVLAHFLKRKW